MAKAVGNSIETALNKADKLLEQSNYALVVIGAVIAILRFISGKK